MSATLCRVAGLAIIFAIAFSWTYVGFSEASLFRPSDGRDSLSFTAPKTSPVAMTVFDTTRYQLGTAQGADDYSKLVPADGHLVYISKESDGSDEEEVVPHTVTLFHQLKCLAILRDQSFRDPSTRSPPITRHCMNYLRQTILCHPSLKMESGTSGLGEVTRTYEAVCKDWTAVYQEAERNQRAFAEWRNSSLTM